MYGFPNDTKKIGIYTILHYHTNLASDNILSILFSPDYVFKYLDFI